MLPVSLSAILLGVLFLLVSRLAGLGRRQTGLPPGPPTSMLVGNLLEMPRAYSHLKFTAWARQYGPILSLKLFSQTMIILSSPQAIRAIIEKANGQSQGRPGSWLLAQYAFQGVNVTFLSDTEKVSRLRRALTSVLQPTASARYVPVLEAESCQLLYNLMTNPGGYYTETKRYTFSLILALTYGIRAPRWESPWVQTFFEYMHTMELLAALPMVYLMDLFPILRRIPDRFSEAKQLATSMRNAHHQLTKEVLQIVKTRLDKSGGNGAIMEDVVRKQPDWALSDEEVREIGGTLLIGGSDTTSSFLLSTLLLLAANVDAQNRAHQELDRVVGPDRLPTLDDVASLPYICALVKEVERMRPTLPFRVPHCMTEDVEYDGYTLSKGAVVLYNWAVGHDPTLFPDPEKFNPERFLDDEHAWWRADTSPVWIFGGGRRMCVGMHFAKNALHLGIARLLWAFNFRPPLDHVTGKPVILDMMNYTEGMIPQPYEFPCEIEVRSEAHKKAITQELQDKAIPQLKIYEEGLTQDDMAYLAASRGVQ